MVVLTLIEGKLVEGDAIGVVQELLVDNRLLDDQIWIVVEFESVEELVKVVVAVGAAIRQTTKSDTSQQIDS